MTLVFTDEITAVELCTRGTLPFEPLNKLRAHCISGHNNCHSPFFVPSLNVENDYWETNGLHPPNKLNYPYAPIKATSSHLSPRKTPQVKQK